MKKRRLHREKRKKIAPYSIKGKSAIAVARQFYGKKRNFTGEQLWARGYAVSTVGFELAKIKEYIKNQESLDNKQDEEGFF